MRINILTWLAVGFTIFACKPNKKPETESKGGEKSPKPKKTTDGNAQESWASDIVWDFVESTDLKYSNNLKPLTANKIKEKMQVTTDYYSDSPDDDSEAALCIKEIWRNIKIKATKTTASVENESDVAKCWNDENTSFKSAKMTTHMAVACENGDLSKLNGKTLDQSDQLDCDDGKKLWMVLTRTNYVFSTKQNGSTYETRGTSISSTSTADGAPCSATGTKTNESIDDGCQTLSISRFETTSADDKSSRLAEESVELNIFDKIVATRSNAKSGSWYQSGSMTTTINNWKGAVNFKDANTAPTYTLTSDKGEKLTGTVGANAGSPGGSSLKLTEEIATPHETSRNQIEALHRKLAQRMQLP